MLSGILEKSDQRKEELELRKTEQQANVDLQKQQHGMVRLFMQQQQLQKTKCCCLCLPIRSKLEAIAGTLQSYRLKS